jgi:hypothetical protein
MPRRCRPRSLSRDRLLEIAPKPAATASAAGADSTPTMPTDASPHDFPDRPRSPATPARQRPRAPFPSASKRSRGQLISVRHRGWLRLPLRERVPDRFRRSSWFVSFSWSYAATCSAEGFGKVINLRPSEVRCTILATSAALQARPRNVVCGTTREFNPRPPQKPVALLFFRHTTI